MSIVEHWYVDEATVKRSPIVLATLLATMSGISPGSFAAGHDVVRPRVPADKLAEARALRSPLPDSPETVEKGKALYAGKGACVNCHGLEGAGNGPVAAQLNPLPRNFQHHGFWRHRTEGEIFWVIKHGSPGTSMIGFVGQLTDEEIWAIMQYVRTFSRHQGMRGMGGRGPMGHMGPRGGMDQPDEEADGPPQDHPEEMPKSD